MADNLPVSSARRYWIVQVNPNTEVKIPKLGNTEDEARELAVEFYSSRKAN